MILFSYPEDMFQHSFRSLHAPEFPDGLSWLNHQPLFLKQLHGKAVLLVFFTETDAASLSLISHIQHWHEAYAMKGLAVIGVHVPEFAFQKPPQHVALSLKRAEITYPIVLDAEHKLARLYANHWIPRTFLIDQQGKIVADHIGVVGLAQIEQEIQELLFSPITPTISCGFVHGQFGNADDMIPNEEQAFTDSVMHSEGALYLHGHFTVTNDSVGHTRSLPSAMEYLRIVYRAGCVDVVARSMGHKEAIVEIELDGKPLLPAFFGTDVEERKGASIVRVKEPRLYRLIHAPTDHKATLTIRTASDLLECFSFHFEGCEKPFSALG
jgi:thiol-disulfide isomerase/thioredoxin